MPTFNTGINWPAQSGLWVVTPDTLSQALLNGVLNIVPGQLYIWSAGSYNLTLTGQFNTVQASADNLDNNTITGGNGVGFNTVLLGNGNGNTVSLGGPANVIQVGNGSGNQITPGCGVATVSLGSGVGNLVCLAGILNTVVTKDVAGHATTSNTIKGGAGFTTVVLGNGDNVVNVGGALDTVIAGDGNNTVTVGTDQANVADNGTTFTLTFGALKVVLPHSVGNAGIGFLSGGVGDIGAFSGGAYNIGAFNGLGSTSGNGQHNKGVLSGIDDTGIAGVSNGSYNIGAWNGNGNGGGGWDPVNKVFAGNGDYNTGAFSGNLSGNTNNSNASTIYNGYGNFGAYDGNLDGNSTNTGGGLGDTFYNGYGNVGSLDGNGSGNALINSLTLYPSSVWATVTGALLTAYNGSIDTVSLGNGNNTVTALGGLGTVVVGTGVNTITIGGNYNTVVTKDVATSNQIVFNNVSGVTSYSTVRVGDANDSVSLTGNNNTVTTGIGNDSIRLLGNSNQGHNVVLGGGGNDFIRLTGIGNLVASWSALGFNPDTNANTIDATASNGDTFATGIANGFEDIIKGFTVGTVSGTVDVLDLRKSLAAAGWTGGNPTTAPISFASDGAGGTLVKVAGTTVADLLNVANNLQNRSALFNNQLLLS